MTRRDLLQRLGGVWAGFLVILLAPPLLFWWRTSRSGPSATGAWVDLGSARKIPEGQWLPRRFALARWNRWRLETVEQVVYVRRFDRDITVVNAICPHARCLVRTAGAGFSCPCHRSAFDSEGRPTEGPSPRPLDRLEWKVRGGKLLVDYREGGADATEGTAAG